jgi:hypothetical protein
MGAAFACHDGQMNARSKISGWGGEFVCQRRFSFFMGLDRKKTVKDRPAALCVPSNHFIGGSFRQGLWISSNVCQTMAAVRRSDDGHRWMSMRFAFFEPPISDRPVVYMSRDGRLRLLTAPCLLQIITV